MYHLWQMPDISSYVETLNRVSSSAASELS